MPEPIRCDNTKPHYFHDHTQDVEVRCTGVTRCGEQIHEPHVFVETQRLWCHGICACGSRSRGLHGPGDHK